MNVASSLLDPPAEGVLGPAAGWITSLLSGSAMTSLCVIAVAALGMMMLSGRMPIRRGAEVVLGCFLLMSAGAVSLGLRELGGEFNSAGGAVQPLVIERDVPPALPPANYDPYGGASLRRKDS